MNEIICGDALEKLKTLPSGIVQTCVTSPPYFGLRDYGVSGQIGLEDAPEAYIARLVEVFREVRRVLRDDGTLWVNIGDSYASPIGGNNIGLRTATYGKGSERGKKVDELQATRRASSVKKHIPGLKPKDLIGIPWMLAFALRADGWYLRSDIIWHKPNCMPESVEDRPTKAHEYIFLLSKNERYFYDADAIREPISENTIRKQNLDENGKGYLNNRKITPQDYGTVWKSATFAGNMKPDARWSCNPAGRNKRSVWTVATMPYSEAHFATFPPKLIEPCILAGTSPRACEQCGAPWERVTEREQITRPRPHGGKRDYIRVGGDDLRPIPNDVAGVHVTTTGWQTTCSHDNEGSGQCIVLDPFCGAGTVPLVSLKYHRQYIGIELNADYVELINKRIHTTQPVLWEVSA